MSLNRLPLILRFLFLLAGASVPWVIAGALFFGRWGILGGFVLSDLFILLLAFQSEAIFVRAFRAEPLKDPGVLVSYDSVIRGIELEWGGFIRMWRPKLFVYPDLLPNSATIRSIGSAGTVLLSRGLLGQLSESELRSALRGAVLRVEEPEWTFSSLCGALAALIGWVAPPQWTSLFFSEAVEPERTWKYSPSSLIRFVCLYPWIRFALALSAQVPAAGGSESWIGATRKIAHQIRPGIRVCVPAAIRLYLVDPSPETQLIRHS